MGLFGKSNAKKTNGVKKTPSKKNNQKGAPNPKEVLTAADFVTESKDWYRSQYVRMTKAVFVVLGILFLSFLLNLFLLFKEPPTRFFATSNDLRVVELTPLDDPLVTDVGLSNWVAEVVSETFSYSFVEWREKFVEIRQHYTDQSYKNLLLAIRESGNLDMVRKNRLVSKAGVDPSRVIITNRGLLNGKQTWRLEVPLNVTYESSEGTTNRQELMGMVVVQRVSVVEHPRGVKIIQMRFK